jgi:hypothetical protein
MAACLALAIALGTAGFLADLGRVAARSEGWYEDRRRVQALIVLVMALSAVGCAALIWVGLTGTAVLTRMILTVTGCLVSYLTIRTVSLHQIDAILLPEAGRGIRRGDVIEVGLVLVLVALAAVSGRSAKSDDA